jgi:hypothetical protein
MSKYETRGPLTSISSEEQEIMARLLRMKPEQQKDAPKPATAQADAQRRRRERERQRPNAASGGD